MKTERFHILQHITNQIAPAMEQRAGEFEFKRADQFISLSSSEFGTFCADWGRSMGSRGSCMTRIDRRRSNQPRSSELGTFRFTQVIRERLNTTFSVDDIAE